MDFSEALQQYYARGEEADRLSTGVGLVESLRTKAIIDRNLPPPPTVIADIGGGPGHYTDWLIERGYTVIHGDLVQHHVDQVIDRHGSRCDSAVRDARALDLADASVDAMMLLGPLYHLPDAEDRARVLQEAARVVRPGGPVWIAAITRWVGRIHAVLHLRAPFHLDNVLDEVAETERTGIARPLFPGAFNGYYHRPGQLRDELEASPLELESLVAVEGVALHLGDLDERLAEEAERELLLGVLEALEDVPELLGAGPHLLATARVGD